MANLDLAGIITRMCSDLRSKFSKVSIIRSLTSGTNSATITVDGTDYKIYAPTPPTASTTVPKMDGTASYGSGTSYARSNHIHPTDTSRQETLVSGTNIKTINGDSLLGSGDITISGGGGDQWTWYGTCSTAVSTAAKSVTCTGFTLTAGRLVSVLFSNGNTANAPTLNVNSTGAKVIWFKGAVTSSTNQCKWPAGSTVTFIYDGTQWHYVSESLSRWRSVSTTTSSLSSSFDTRDVRLYVNDRLRLLYVYVHYENTGGTNVTVPSNGVFLTGTDALLRPSANKAILDGFRYSADGKLLDFPVNFYQNGTSGWGMRGPSWSFNASAIKFHGTIPFDALGIS